MFNPLTPAEVVGAIGRAARDAARSEEPASEFARGQLMSAYSASRHLGVELESFEPELRLFGQAVAACIRQRADAGGDGERMAALADRVEATSDARAVGDAVCELLDALRGDAGVAAGELRTEVRSLLRQLADREVDLLADVIEGPARA